MTSEQHIGAVAEFYETHPISEKQILEKLENDGIGLDGLTEDILQDYDQDHYGGTAANDALAALAGIDGTCHVLDVCCGLGGPSRYMAHNFGCRVTGIDMTGSRIDGANRFAELTGLADRVTFQCANALDLPFVDGTFDILISQEAFCHVPDKDRLVAECTRVVMPGGRIAFTDILTTDSTTDATRERLQREMTFLELGSREDYRKRFEREGCTLVEVHDLAEEWRVILADRLAMYRSLKDQTVERFGEAHFRKWDDAYSFFVGLYETRELGGGRFLARREDD
jgi:ubiquinone/menaquinone biosynthesis C-methylase UbiE